MVAKVMPYFSVYLTFGAASNTPPTQLAKILEVTQHC